MEYPHHHHIFSRMALVLPPGGSLSRHPWIPTEGVWYKQTTFLPPRYLKLPWAFREWRRLSAVQFVDTCKRRHRKACCYRWIFGHPVLNRSTWWSPPPSMFQPDGMRSLFPPGRIRQRKGELGALNVNRGKRLRRMWRSLPFSRVTSTSPPPWSLPLIC